MSAVEPGKIARRRSARYGELGYARAAADFYPTPDWVTDVARDRLTLPGSIWEPACGDGRMARRLRNAGYTVFASDIRADADGDCTADFFGHGLLPVCEPEVRTIFTNPPFSRATDFAIHALQLVEPVGGMLVLLLRHDWDCAAGRIDLVRKLSRKITITRRIRWIDGTTGSPREHHAWYVWDARRCGEGRMEWAP